MSDVTHKSCRELNPAIQRAEQLLPLVYDELRKLAAARMAAESPDQTLQPTALVHEAYLRLISPGDEAKWENRGHFFAAAAEADAAYLVDAARRKMTRRHGGAWQRSVLPDALPDDGEDAAQTLAVHQRLDQLAEQSPRAADVAKMCVFLQMTFVEIGDVLRAVARVRRQPTGPMPGLS